MRNDQLIECAGNGKIIEHIQIVILALASHLFFELVVVLGLFEVTIREKEMGKKLVDFLRFGCPHLIGGFDILFYEVPVILISEILSPETDYSEFLGKIPPQIHRKNCR